MSKSVSIQLISNGEGQVLVFINGQPHNGVYFCGNSLSLELEQLLEKHLVKYLSSQSVKEELPF